MTTEPDNQLVAVSLALVNDGIQVEQSAALSAYTTFRLGGPTPLLINCASESQLTRSITVLNGAGIPWTLIGGGSNLLVSDLGLESAVIRFAAAATQAITHRGVQLMISAAASLDDVAAYCCTNGLGEFVKASGIPGTVGGAIVGNAGAFGWQVGDALDQIEILEADGTKRTLTAAELGFSYRNSKLKHSNQIVVSATFTLEQEPPEKLLLERREILALRAEKHPNLAVDSCAGSFFRNVEPTSKADRRQAAGWFLEQVGAKTMRVGGAIVFAKHANIPIKGDPSCTAADVHQLTTQMAAAVKTKFDLDLIREVQLLGKF